MKRLLRSLLLGAILSALLCVGALAAESEPVKGGIYDISGSVTLTPKDASDKTIEKGSSDGVATDGYYANAVKFDVKAENLTENQQYLLMVLKGGADGSAPGVPTAENIAYIDQAAAQNGSVSFAAYPKELTKGTYYVYLVGGGTAFSDSQVASFEYDKKYTLGDVNEDGMINVLDAMDVIYHIVGTKTLNETQMLAANVLRGGSDDTINVKDAMQIIYYIVGTITSFD